ncbi:condensation domain-containing protein, partial [Steroidobacter flavus]
MTANSASVRPAPDALSTSKAKLLELLLERKARDAQRIKPCSRGDGNTPPRLPTSGAQHRLWFIHQLEGGSPAYHIGFAARLRGDLNRAALDAALRALIARHEALRTVFPEVEGEPVQEIRSHIAFQLRQIELPAGAAGEAELLRHGQEELATPFDLAIGPMIRGRLLRLEQDEHVLLLTLHHLIADGWSIGVLIRELGKLYETHLSGEPASLPPLVVQYADYAQWQRQWLAGPELQQQLGYWRQHLQGSPELLELPGDRPRPAVQSYRGGNVSVALELDLSRELKGFCRQLDVTLAMTLYTAWAIVLARLSGQDDLVIGMPVANRERAELEGVLGLFVNMLPVRVQLTDDPNAGELLRRVKSLMLAAYAHQAVPFEEVVKALQPTRSLRHSPIFQVTFALQNAPGGELRLPGLTLMEQPLKRSTAQFDLTLALLETPGGIVGSLNYASDLFDAETIERWAGCFKSVLRGMVREPQLRVSRLPFTSGDERRQLLEEFNATQLPYPQTQLIHELFEAQVSRTPTALAVMYETQSLTYEQLNGRANQLARYLRARGVGPDRRVGICIERSLEMVIGVLGTLKAGGAYVPLDPNYPAERLRYMIEDAAPQVLLIQAQVRERLPATSIETVALDDDWIEIAHEASSDLSRTEQRANQLAYVIYTSGSTGQPKGVMIEHRQVLNLWQGLEQRYAQVGGCQRVALNASFNFDASVQQFVQLLSGRT